MRKSRFSESQIVDPEARRGGRPDRRDPAPAQHQQGHVTRELVSVGFAETIASSEWKYADEQACPGKSNQLQ
jgi:hypothetical protein